MIMDMPRPRPPHLHAQVTRHGKIAWYVRKNKGLRVRIRAQFGTEDFNAQYQAAITGECPASAGKAKSGTLAWLLEQYRSSGVWLKLALATRRQRENIFKHVLKTAGQEAFTDVTKRTIQAGIDRRSATPAQARHFYDAMRGLFQWAKSADYVQKDPTAEIEKPPKPKNGGFPAWTIEDVAAYRARWALGTRQRVWLEVLLNVFTRRGDAVLIGKQHVRDGIIHFKTEKSGEMIDVTIRILPALQEAINAGPVGDLAFIIGARGQPFVKEAFGNEFSDAARAAGVRKSAHGVRKIAAELAAEAGATDHELDAMFGWVGGKTSRIYTAKASRKKMALAGVAKLNVAGTSIPSPEYQVRAAPKKTE